MSLFSDEIEPEIPEKVSFEETENKVLSEEKTLRENYDSRFVRLKKSLRKKSASIL
jgi:hypothetical protein